MKYSNLSNASQELLEGRIELSFNGSQLKEVKRATTNVRVSNKLQSPFNFF